MLTWMGFIGKLIEFMTTKLIGKKLDLALDEKKRACKAFIKFFDSLSQLEMLFGEFVNYIEKFVAGSNSHIYRVHLAKVTSRLNDASNEFLNSLESLGPVIYLYDPNLTRLFSTMMHAKMRFVQVTSQFFQSSHEEYDFGQESGNTDVESIKQPIMRFDQFTVDNPNFRGLDFTMPSEELMEIDLNEIYDSALSERYATGMSIYQKSSTLDSYDILLNLVKDKYIEEHLGPDDIDKLVALYPILKAHQEVLAQARESLREFIRQRFSLEDLLYVTV